MSSSLTTLSPECIGFTNNVTNATLQQALSAYSFYQGFALNSSNVQSLVVTTDTKLLSALLVSGSVPFIIAGLVFLAIFGSLLLCCLLDKHCPPCKSLRRDTKLRPYTKFELTINTAIYLLFLTGVLGMSLYGLSAVQGLQNSITGTKCAIQQAISTAVNGDSGGKWGGFQNLVYKVGNISGALDTANSMITTNLGSDNRWLITTMQNLKQKNYAFYPKYNDSQLSSPNSDTSTRISSISSQFIVNRLGPPSLNGTMVFGINQVLENSKRLTDRGFAVDQSARQMQSGTPFIQANFNNSINQLNMFITQLQIFSKSLRSTTTSIMEDYFTTAIYVLQGLVGLILASSMLGITGAVATHFLGIVNCRNVIHMSWLLMSFTYLFVIFFTYISGPGGAVLSNFCLFFNETLRNETSFKRYGSFAPENVLNKVGSCLFKKGDVQSTFGMNSQLNTVLYLFTNITDFNQMQDSGVNVYVNLGLVNTQITSWQTVISNRMKGIWSDSFASDISLNNPDKALQKFSSLTNINTNSMPHTGCTSILDQWKYDLANCSAANQVTDYNFDSKYANGNAVCLSFDHVDNRPSLVLISKRYTSLLTYPGGNQQCSGIYKQLVKQTKTLIQYRQSRIQLFQSILNDLSNLQESYNKLKSSIATFASNVNIFKTNIQTLDALIQDSVTGIIYTSNCSDIGVRIFDVNNQLCYSMVSNTYVVAVSMLTLMFVMLATIVSGYMLGNRYAEAVFHEQVAPDDAIELHEDKADLAQIE